MASSHGTLSKKVASRFHLINTFSRPVKAKKFRKIITFFYFKAHSSRCYVQGAHVNCTKVDLVLFTTLPQLGNSAAGLFATALGCNRLSTVLLCVC